MTVADMERLENAARLSMGGLAETEVPIKLAHKVPYAALAGLAVAAALLMAAAFHLL